MSEQSKPANPSDLLTHPVVVHAIRRETKRMTGMRIFRRIPREDIRADLQLEVAIRLQLFDPSRSSLNTYASIAARSGAASMIRARATQGRCGDMHTVSIEVATADRPDAAAFLSDGLARATGRQATDEMRTIDIKEALEAVLRTLPPHLADVATALSHCTRNAACIRLQMSRRQLDQLTDELREICDLIDLRP